MYIVLDFTYFALLVGKTIPESQSVRSNLPLRKEDFRVSSTREYQELTKYPALSQSSNIIPLRDAEDVQTEDGDGIIKHNVTIDNEMFTGKSKRVEMSTNAGGKNEQISSSKLPNFVSNILYIVKRSFLFFVFLV